MPVPALHNAFQIKESPQGLPVPLLLPECATIAVPAKGVFRGKYFAALPSCAELPDTPSSVLVSYSKFQKDETQRQNFDFFVTVGMGIPAESHPPNFT